MVTDSISNVSIPSSPKGRDVSKKKRARTAKLKQSKLDVRREQWLSQGAIKNKARKEQTRTVPIQMPKEDKHPLQNLEIRKRGEENDGSNRDDGDFSDSSSNSPTSLTTTSSLGSTDSGPLSTGSSSMSSSGCYSGSITEEDGEADDGCLDDWEAFADALAAKDKQNNLSLKTSPECEIVPESVPQGELRDGLGSGIGDSKPKGEKMDQGTVASRRAWSPHDTDRPQSLPNLSKQLSLLKPDRHYGYGGTSWACGSAISTPTSCPICCEDLDITDSSFFPCLCGFHICLFCHKRILEEDGRCPGCRKPYQHDFVNGDVSVLGGSPMFRLAGSCSMITRS